MPKWCGGVTVAVLGWLTIGCVAHRPAQMAVTPEYSYLRDGGRIAAAIDPADPGGSVEELAAPDVLSEDALLTPPLPRSELVHTNRSIPAE